MSGTGNIFGSQMSVSQIKSAQSSVAHIASKYGDDRSAPHHFSVERHPVLEELGGRLVVPSAEEFSYNDVARPIIIATIGETSVGTRSALAMCSAARALGYTSLWFDLSCYPASGAMARLKEYNAKENRGGALAQKNGLYQRLIWEGSHIKQKRKLSQNLMDFYTNELLVPYFMDFKPETPVVAMHAFAAHGAVHAGMQKIVNALPGNCPLGVHLADGTIHTAQTPYAFLGYKMLRGMGSKTQECIPENEIVYSGHYVDHLMVQHLERDCDKRMQRAKNGALRWVISFDDLSLDKNFLINLFQKLLPLEKEGRAVISINIGKNRTLWNALKTDIPDLRMWATEYPDDYIPMKDYTDSLRTKKDIEGIHVFSSDDFLNNIYTTNMLIRGSDILVCRANELAFYPIPKLIAPRMHREEYWGGLHTSEIGDGTFECNSVQQMCQMIEVLDKDRDVFIAMCKTLQKNQSNGLYGGAYEAVRLATE